MPVSITETNRLIKWIRDYLLEATSAHTKIKAVIGLSGGIDSAVAAAACVRAVGVTSVVGVILPCESPLEDTLDANELAKSLGIYTVAADLEPAIRNIWDVYRYSIGWPGQQERIFPPINHMVKANAKARLRMILLYMVANHTGGLVIGTTNYTESQLGYFTKYGDGGVDIEPFIEFYKTEIWEMAHLFKESFSIDIPSQIIKRPPTANLWDGQTDEQELGASYQVIDEYLQGVCMSFPDGFNQNLIRAAAHKRLNLPHFQRKIEVDEVDNG